MPNQEQPTIEENEKLGVGLPHFEPEERLLMAEAARRLLPALPRIAKRWTAEVMRDAPLPRPMTPEEVAQVHQQIEDFNLRVLEIQFRSFAESDLEGALRNYEDLHRELISAQLEASANERISLEQFFSSAQVVIPKIDDEIRAAYGGEEPVTSRAMLCFNRFWTCSLQALARIYSRLREAHLEGLHQQIAERERLLAERAAELARSNRELEQFAYVASHDLQEPLRMVASYVQLLARRYRDKLDEQGLAYIGFAEDGAKRMRSLINDLLDYSRVGTRGGTVEPADSGVALQQALANLRAAIDQHGALIQVGSMPMVMAESQQLVQLFQNLIGNAIKFRSQQPPQIEVGAERDGREWRFTVRDNGIGIDPRFADRIFMIFQRLHTRSKYPGTGIGLAICKKIVERHGGRIWVQSQPGQGASFCFTMPADAEDVSHEYQL